MAAVTNNHNSVVELLLRTPNIDVNKKDGLGLCALHTAVSCAQVVKTWRRTVEYNEAVKLLLNVPNIDVNIVDPEGRTAVHHAVVYNNIEGLKLLLDVPGIDVNIVDDMGRSAVHWAVNQDNSKALKLLLSHPGLTSHTLNQKMDGFSRGQKNAKNKTPVKSAIQGNRLKCLSLLVADLRVDLDTKQDLKSRVDCGRPYQIKYGIPCYPWTLEEWAR